MKKIFFTIMAVVMCAVAANAQCVYPTDTVKIKFKIKPQGVLEGDFTINSSGGKVRFSQGNLKYTRASTDVDWSTGHFSFMSNQYDLIETAGTCEVDNADRTAIGIFAWATSGWDNTSVDETSVHYQPWSTSNSQVASSHPHFNLNKDQHGPSATTMEDGHSWSESDATKNYDWGVYNSSDLGSGWRTLTNEEWDYLFTTRTNASNLFTYATVNGVTGIILMPDGWTVDGVSLTITKANFTTNNITLINWGILEEQGCVFLPGSCLANGTEIGWAGNLTYWSSTARVTTYKGEVFTQAYCISGYSGNSVSTRFFRRPVRLVIDVE